jgi:hypothetical protein
MYGKPWGVTSTSNALEAVHELLVLGHQRDEVPDGRSAAS